MIMENNKIAKIVEKWYDNLITGILKGNAISLSFFLFVGIIILAFLFLTVHNREPMGKPYNTSSVLNDQSFIQNWLDHGYLKHGGMRIVKIDEANNKVKIYRSSFYAHYIIPYFLVKLHAVITGDNQYYALLVNIYNQTIIMISAALMALLAMRLGMRLGVEPLQMVGIGGGIMFVWQTMHVNLISYWTTFSCFLLPVFFIGFLLLSEKGLFKEREESFWHMSLRGAVVFGALWSGDYLALFFFAFYFGCWLFLGHRKNILTSHLVKNFIFVYLIPTIMVIGIVRLQRLLVESNYKQVIYQGSTFFFRSGLDGSVTYFSQLNLFSRFAQHYYSPFLLIGGMLILILAIGLSGKYDMRYMLFSTLALLAPFLICATLFQQAVMLHPHTYYNLLMLPAVLACFGILPAILLKLCRNHGAITMIFILIAFGYGLNSLRSYAVAFPPTQYFYKF